MRITDQDLRQILKELDFMYNISVLKNSGRGLWSKLMQVLLKELGFIYNHLKSHTLCELSS